MTHQKDDGRTLSPGPVVEAPRTRQSTSRSRARFQFSHRCNSCLHQHPRGSVSQIENNKASPVGLETHVAGLSHQEETGHSLAASAVVPKCPGRQLPTPPPTTLQGARSDHNTKLGGLSYATHMQQVLSTEHIHSWLGHCQLPPLCTT